MSNYNSVLTITIPATHVEIAKRISRALDPDVGGYDAFDQRDENGTLLPTQVYQTPCTAEFAGQVQWLLANSAEALCGLVAQDYATRWPDEVAPTLAECDLFIANALVVT